MRTTLPLTLLTTGLLAVLAVPAGAGEALKGRTWHFGTHPARTNITFVSEADLETIHGVAHAVEGTLAANEDGTRASGTLKVPVAAMKTGIDLRDEHLRSDQWLDAARHPYVTLRIDEATEGKDGRTWRYRGSLTIKGVTRKVEGETRVRAIPDELGKILGKGSWVRVQAAFDVRLSDFGIEVPQAIGAKVSEVWKIGVDLYGTTAAPERSDG